ncbi:stonustoxin subunit beta-like [Amia ocellicauda]|uniref:stonustoxin subunit beta-like n=1 Tax=Amia ocellicauda TaxID=2972642 RepID=UPI003464B1BA
MEAKPIEMSALGRPLYPGMLYGCRDDSFIPGVTLWDIEAVRKHLDVHPKPNTEINITASDSLHEKSSLLDVSASLKASFLGGLVEVGGSARYLNDTVTSTQQCRVTMQYKQTTEFKQLTMTELGNVTYPEVFEKKTATHVITAVLYGAQAFLVFDQTASKNESKQDIQGNLQMMVKKIPLFSIGCKGALIMTEEDKKKVEKFSCKFYGDFQLKQNPTTYLEAVQVYSKLPELLGEKGEKAVPVRVWLYPLIDLDSNAARLVREISVSLVSEAEKVLEQLAEAYVRSHSLIGNSLVRHFTDLKNKLEDFQGMFEPYKDIFQKALSRILPAIRGGGKEEQALVDILQVHHKSPLTHKQMEKWLDDKDDEIQALRSYTFTMKSIHIVSTAELQGVLFDPQIDIVFCFAFTSLKYKDQYLSTLTQYLQSEEFRKLETSRSVLNYLKEEPQPWFKSPELSASMRVNLQLFTEFSKANMVEERTKFVITSLSDPSNPGASIRLYRRGKLEDPRFKPVSKPPPLDLTDIQRDQVTLKLLPSPTGKTERYRVEHRAVQTGDKTGTKPEEQQWTVTDTPDTQETWTLSGLKPATLYQVRYRVISAVGVSKESDTTEITTKPDHTPPQELSVKRVGQGKVEVTWKMPAPPEQSVLWYSIEYKDERWKDWVALLTKPQRGICTIEGLKFTNSYRFRLRSVFREAETSTPCKESKLPPLAEPKTRDDFLLYSCQLTLDPNTVHMYLILSEENRKMTDTEKDQPYPEHPERFDHWRQALCRESLSGSRCYWEVEWSNMTYTAVTYKGIGRKGHGHDCVLGGNDQSWMMGCGGSSYRYWYKNVKTEITVPFTRRIGVYLDHSAGILSFYSISDTLKSMTLLHTVKTTFTEPLYPALGVYKGTVTLCKLG